MSGLCTLIWISFHSLGVRLVGLILISVILLLAPSDQFRTETAFLLVCDGDRYVQVLLPDVVVGFHAWSPRVASDSNLLVVLVLVPACCFYVSRADSIAVAAVTPSARCAWSVLLPAVGYALLFLGSWVPSLAVFCSWVLGSLSRLFLFF